MIYGNLYMKATDESSGKVYDLACTRVDSNDISKRIDEMIEYGKSGLETSDNILFKFEYEAHI